ncbi:arabinogalactan endo-1,4-beta-galactosidase [Sphingomonas cannabina]|uniref:glycosyl hydrolase 53 family protein n=1 Tax=Sphingomonas cannabina TaxID=2899123 RepID=UPI001F2FAB6F|nr:glycosyl hydrolase 53 family protein [Sphingomonas cannabina]UIJ45024.1 arabinogalactan endo-1,4-beta-galactosidase [Sphingomonas cannabina]
MSRGKATHVIGRREALGLLALSALSSPLHAARRTGARPGPYMLGADITWIAEDEAAGARYFVGGVQRDPIAILKDAGFNWIRLRMFVDPARGYSARAPDRAWGGLARTVELGRRVKAADMGLALSFHFSDTWADPEHQGVPAAWRGLDLGGLAGAVEAHVRDSLRAMRAGGAPVDMAVIGNEISFGMLWPQGRVRLTTPTGNPVTDANHRNAGQVGGFDALALLLRAGIAGARAAEPAVLIQLHNHLGRHWPIVREWTDALVARNVDFDVIGLSCYQQLAQGDWERTFRNFIRRYPEKGLLVAEYSSRKRYINDLVHALPGKRGWGTFIWEPTRHQEAVFDLDGRNAGGGPKPDLLSQGLNGAEAPGGLARAAAPPAPPPPPPRLGRGGDYRANAWLDEYRRMAKDYGLR